VSRPGVAFLVWAVFLALLATVLWAVFTELDLLSVLMPAFAIALTALLALAGAGAARRAARSALDAQPDPDTSWSAVLAGIALALVLLGLEVGTFLVFVGGGLLALAGGGLVREWRAERRAR
jgi:chromate transport protein ChrA